MKMTKKIIATVVLSVFLLGVLTGITALGINAQVVISVQNRILTQQDASALTGVDCILVLGCKVQDNGVPSHMLEDRLKRGVALYQAGAAPKLLMSGDHGQDDYDEVNAMKRYAVEAGVDSEDVFMDHAGFSTYESMYRAKEVFGAEKIIIVTQRYHLFRAIFAAQQLGLEAYGVDADYRVYSGQILRDIREVLARVKDYGTALLQPKPTYLGEHIPVSGNGDITND